MNTVDGLVDRPRYTERIRPFIGNGNAKIITGIRRCGKSSVMRLFSRSFADHNVVYLNMELAENYDLRDWRSLLRKAESEVDAKKKNVLFIDEVQNVEKWELAIRDIIARELYDVYLTGSNSDLLSSEYATHLGGRFNAIRMLPLSYTECLGFRKIFGGTDDVFNTFMRAGGFPVLWRNPTDIQSDMQTVRDLVDVSIANDIEERFNIKNKQLLKDLLRYTLSTIGNYVSANNLYNTMRSAGIRVSADTVYEYLRYLESANIIIRAETFDIKGKRVLTTKYKYYVTDLGIKHSLLGYRPEDTPGHMENIIFTELLGRGYNVYIGYSNGKEIDFVAEKGDNRIYVQACQTIRSEETMKREFGNLESIKDNFPKYVVMMDPGVYEGTTGTGIICCSLTKFLSFAL